MAGQKAMFTGVDSIVMAWMQLMPTPFFSVWSGNDLLFSNNVDDEQKAEELLRQNLQTYCDNDNSDLLKLKVHPEQADKYITSKTPSINVMYIRCVDLPGGAVGNVSPGYNNQTALSQTLTKINNDLIALHAKANDPDDEEDEEDEIDRISGLIDKIDNSPTLGRLINHFFKIPMGNNSEKRSPILSGIPEDQIDSQYEIALQILFDKEPQFKEYMIKLAHIATKDPDTFEMLLKKLKKFEI